MISGQGADPWSLGADDARQRLQRRATALATIRQYFASQQVIEVETPLLRDYAAGDAQLDSLAVDAVEPHSGRPGEQYLATSPEVAMKQLLSLGSGSIFQLCKAFRDDPPGRLHAREFTMLEWYRVGFTMRELIDDVAALVNALLPARPVALYSYRQLFLDTLSIDPFAASLDELEQLARARIDVQMPSAQRDDWLDLLLTHCLEPGLGRGELSFVHGYPASQAAMAQLDGDDGDAVALRFELYIDGTEIANGYQELIDPDEQQRRQQHDNVLRERAGKRVLAPDTQLLAALQRGLPPCAGVALGVDRLLWVADQRDDGA